MHFPKKWTLLSTKRHAALGNHWDLLHFVQTIFSGFAKYETPPEHIMFSMGQEPSLLVYHRGRKRLTESKAAPAKQLFFSRGDHQQRLLTYLGAAEVLAEGRALCVFVLR